MTTDHTPRDTAERLINHSRKARPIDLPGIGNVAAAAAILDLADAIREAHTPPLVDPEIDEDEGPAPEPCAADGCVLFDGHEGEHSATRPPIDIPHMTTVRGGPRYHHALHTDGTVTPFAAITVDHGEPEFCTRHTRSDRNYWPDAANRFLEKPVHLHTGEDDDTDSKLLTRFLEWLERELYIDKSRGWHLKGIADEYLATPPEARS